MNVCCSQMNLVFFEDAVKHLIRISRVMHHSRGSAMLIGIGGSGKQSLTRLAAAIADCACSQIEATANYGPSDFRDDLKDVLRLTGVDNKHVVLLLSDNQVPQEFSSRTALHCYLHTQSGHATIAVIAPLLL